MNPKIKNILFLLVGFSFNLTVSAQTLYTNREWVRETPIVGNTIYHTSSIVSANKLYVTGNIVNGNGDTDIMTIKYDNNGDTLWMKTFAGSSGGNDYGVELKAQGSSIFVIAACENTGTGYDYCLLKYAASDGNLIWSYTWNGTGNATDIPASINFDPSGGAIYICGGSEATNGFSDYGIISISSGGSLNWETYYDFNNLHDGATAVVSKGNVIFVTGGSAAGIGDWDMATIKINKSTGATVNSYRTDIAGATMVEAHSMKIDSSNNLYVTGYAEVSGNKNIQTIKLDSTLTLQWIVDYEGAYDDVANDIGIDADGNIYITGYSEVVAGKPKVVTIKYSEFGDTLWTEMYGNIVSADGVRGQKMVVESNGDVFVTGTASANNVNSFALLKYTTSGQLVLTKEYQAYNLDGDLFSIGVDGNDVYITGFTETTGGRKIMSLKYTLKEKDLSLTNNSTTGTPMYVQRDLIVRVDTSLIKKDQIDNLEKEFWTLSEIFDAGFVENLERQLEIPCDNDHCQVTVYRIFSQMRTTDTISITRSGDTIRVPTFWATFVFELPNGVDLTDASNVIVPLFPDIKYSNYNLVGTLNDVPNDPEYYNGQISLHHDFSPTWEDVHINIEPAWDLETGERFVKVGVFDQRAYWKHEDFGGDDETTTKMNGYDFILNDDIYAMPDPASVTETHGTKVSGIIGAIRNNNLGIAGIAGGSYANGADLDSSGVALYNMGILNHGDTLIIYSHVADAVYASSVNSPGSLYGFGLHIMNHSWGISNDLYYGMSNPWFIDTNIVLLRECFHFANRNEVTVVASRGNSGLLQDSGTYHYNYPGVLDDDWILCVGGLGTDGNYHNMDQPFEYTFKASRGPEIDVSSFSCGSHNWTTTSNGSDYNTFNGTSAAAPHVTGVGALLMSYLNYETDNYANLAPEDVEYILQMTAVDRDTLTNPGYDTLTGYGIIDAGAALNQVKKDRYIVAHFGTDAFPDFTDAVSYSVDDTVTLTERYENAAGDWFLPNTPYIVDTYKIISQSGHQIFTNEIVVAMWPRPSSSNIFALFDSNNMLQPRERASLDSIDNIWGYLSGYIYKVSDSLGNPLGWWPFDTTYTFDLTYTLLKYDTAYYLNNAEIYEPFSAKVYPNPTQSGQTLILDIDQPIDASIRLLDMNGRVIKTIYEGPLEEGQVSYSIDLSGLTSGMYMYAILPANGRPRYIKVMKQ